MVRVVCMIYNNLGDLLKETSKEKEEPERKLKFDPSEIHHGKFSKTPQLSVQQEENANEILAAEIPKKKEAIQKINTKILSVSMTHKHTFLPLEKPVVFVLKHNQVSIKFYIHRLLLVITTNQHLSLDLTCHMKWQKGLMID